MEKSEAAAVLGNRDEEVVAVAEVEDGTVVLLVTGTQYIVLNETDESGKHLWAPFEGEVEELKETIERLSREREERAGLPTDTAGASPPQAPVLEELGEVQSEDVLLPKTDEGAQAEQKVVGEVRTELKTDEPGLRDEEQKTARPGSPSKPAKSKDDDD